MNFQVSKPKTKAAKAMRVKIVERSKANSIPISIDEMILTGVNAKCYFKRLKFKGCPKIKPNRTNGGDFTIGSKLVDMNRDHFIYQMYSLFTDENITQSSDTLRAYFNRLISYVTALDNANRTVDLSQNNIQWYMDYIFSLREKGKISKGTVGSNKIAISFFLKQLGREREARNLPSLRKKNEDAKPTQPMDSNNHTDSYHILYMAYKAYVKHLIEGTNPEFCPIFNEVLLRSMKNKAGLLRYSDEEIKQFRIIARSRVAHGDWRNMMVKIVFFLVARPTGANTSLLSNLKRKHVLLKKIEGDKYVFNLDAIKGRAQFEPQLIPIGFNKREKELMEGWLEISSRFTTSDDDYLFPLFNKNKDLKRLGQNPQDVINKALRPYELEPISCRILRATRSSKFIRATGNEIEAAAANRNSLQTTRTFYANGNKATNEIELAGALVAREKIMKGEEKRAVIDEVKASFRDPLSDYEYQKMKGKTANKTTVGVRCGNPFAERAKKSMRKFASIVDELDNKVVDTCIDFLECFNCPDHVLISEIDDIWIMLSFKDSIIKTISRPSFNSYPSEELQNLLLKIDVALDLLKEHSPDNYAEAQYENDRMPHPLYDDEYAFEDIVRIYS